MLTPTEVHKAGEEVRERKKSFKEVLLIINVLPLFLSTVDTNISFFAYLI
jgi:hypothetical protein